MRRVIGLIFLATVILAAVQPLPVAAQGGPTVPITEDTFFQLSIPSLEIDIPVFEAWLRGRTWEFRIFSQEAGHLQYTAYPGQRGNVVIGAHYALADFTPGPFQDLDQLEVGDLIQVYYLGHLYTYRVTGADLVSPNDLRILRTTPGETLTLLTCYDYSPQAATYTRRYVVYAERVPSH